MSGYVEAGYIVVVVSLGGYALSLLGREKAARGRLRPPVRPTVESPEAEERTEP